jgi:pimeloyl-ACP methyl ester carboxylesterase
MTLPNTQPASLKLIEQGSGSPLVLVHGSGSDVRTWEQQTRPFAAHFHVVTYSRRYHWPNDRIADGAEYAMADQVDDLGQILKSLATSPAHLVGHSYGAYIALVVAIRNPTLIDRLVLAEPPVIPLFTSFPPKPQEIVSLLFTRPRTALPIISFVSTGLGPASSAAKKGKFDEALAHFGKAVLGSESFNSLSAERLEQVRTNFIKAELLSRNYMTPLEAKDVASIDAQTLLVTGEKSPVLFHRLTDRLEDLIPNNKRVDIPNSSHIMHEDNAAAYNQAVLSFLLT